MAGIRTPKPIADLAVEMPAIYTQLVDLRNRLERHYREVQDFEFTIERGTLYCLQTRNGKMNAASMVRTSVEMNEEGILSREEAILRVNPAHLEQMLFPRLDPQHKGQPLATGLPASPGAASGQAVFDADRAETLGKQGRKVILVREETKPEDIHGFFASQGILTSRGGKTSHAAVVARGMGKPCVAGAEGIHVDVSARARVRRRPGDQGRRRHHDRRQQRPRVPRRGADGRGGLLAVAGQAARLGRRASTARRARQRRHARRRRPRDPLRREGHRPVPHRAHVQRRRPAADRRRHDRRRHAGAAARGARPAAADPARGLRRTVQGDGAAPGDRSGCSTRRSTSSCRPSASSRTTSRS